MFKTISVIVPAKNEKKYISQCLDSILAQDYPMEKVEILIVDGMSEDGTRQIVKEYAAQHINIRLIDNPKRITPIAFNLGIKNSNGEIITIISAHSFYCSDYFSKCVEYLFKTGADNVGGPMRAVGHNYISNAIAFAYNSPFGLGGAKFHDENFEGEVDTVYPGCWPRKTFEKVGLFDERLIRNQDIEFDSRTRKKSGRIFLTPKIKSYYYCRSNLMDLWTQNFRNGFWNMKTIKYAPGSLSIRHFVPLVFVVALVIGWINLVLWFTTILSYLVCSIIFTVKIAIKEGFKYSIILPITFLVLHASYGLGLLAGVYELIKNKQKFN